MSHLSVAATTEATDAEAHQGEDGGYGQPDGEGAGGDIFNKLRFLVGNIPRLPDLHGVILGAAGARRGPVDGLRPRGQGQRGNLVSSSSDLGTWSRVRRRHNPVEASEAFLGGNNVICGMRDGRRG